MLKDFDYFQMRAYFYPKESMNSVEFKLHELEALWYCTQKNVKRKLKNFQDEGRCTYIPGKGRGNSSRLIFASPFHKEVNTAVEHLVQKDQLEDLIQLLQLPIPKTWIANVSTEIQNLLGWRSNHESKDILRTVITRNLTTLDPLMTSVNFETFLIHQLGDTLVIYDKKRDEVLPHLAHHWEVSEDQLMWTFYLQKGVRFHNQHFFTSKDVKYTFERFYEGGSPHYWLLEDIQAIDCPSPYIIRFHLKLPNPFFLRYLSSHNLVILPANEPFDEYRWIATGPFQLKKRTDTVLILEAFNDYFLPRPFLDEIEFYRVTKETAPYITYVVDGPGSSDSTIRKPASEVGFRFLAFNLKKPSMIANQSFREAIYHLIDMKDMWADLGRTDLKEASSYFYWKSKPQIKMKERIMPLIEKSGYGGETLTIYTLTYPRYQEEANWIKRQANKYGINLEIKTYTIEELYDPTIEAADMIFMGEVASNDHHLSFIGAFLNKTLIFNRFFSSEHLNTIEKYFEQIIQEASWEKRENLLDEVENFLRAEHLFIYLYHPIKDRIFHPMIKDIEFESFGFVDFRKLWIK
ncbi:ABC transporter substrate-binding protein [Neobacillus drentensis]|uniref:SgrR family transcriptional regulator n=1 Tax=Neobacillus drentensis TaxID=220684 RepID=UPI002FFFDFE1